MTNSQSNQILFFQNAGIEIKEVRELGKSVMLVLKNRVAFIGKRGKVEYKKL